MPKYYCPSCNKKLFEGSYTNTSQHLTMIDTNELLVENGHATGSCPKCRAPFDIQMVNDVTDDLKILLAEYFIVYLIIAVIVYYMFF